MAKFRVACPVKDAPVDDRSAADPRPDRHIGKGTCSLPRTVQVLAQCRAVHIGVEYDGNGKGTLEISCQIAIRPTRFGRFQDVAPFGRCPVKFDRSETRDPHRFQGALAFEPFARLTQRLGRTSRGNGVGRADPGRIFTDSESELGTSCLDGRKRCPAHFVRSRAIGHARAFSTSNASSSSGAGAPANAPSSSSLSTKLETSNSRVTDQL